MVDMELVVLNQAVDTVVGLAMVVPVVAVQAHHNSQDLVDQLKVDVQILELDVAVRKDFSLRRKK